MNECSKCVPLRLLGLVSTTCAMSTAQYSAGLASPTRPGSAERDHPGSIVDYHRPTTAPSTRLSSHWSSIGALQLSRADCRNRRRLHKDSNRLTPLGALVGQKKMSQLSQRIDYEKRRRHPSRNKPQHLVTSRFMLMSEIPHKFKGLFW